MQLNILECEGADFILVWINLALMFRWNQLP